MSLPSTVKALVVQEVNLQPAWHGHRGTLIFVPVQNGTTAVREVPIQTPGENEILVKVKAISINPADWQCSSLSISIGGCFMS